MSNTFAQRTGFGKTGTVDALRRSQAHAGQPIDTRQKVTMGLGSTHGLKTLDDGSNLFSLLKKVSNYMFKDYFMDFDRLRKGFVTEVRFRTGLGNVSAEFTEEQIQQLLSRYRIDEEKINYKAFCDDIHRIFRNEGSSETNFSTTKSKFTRVEATKLSDILKTLRSVIKANRVLMKPSFADFDTTQKQRISVHQFSRVLKQLNIMPSEDEFDLICRHYFDKGNTREVNYVKFCHDVDKPEDMLAELGLKLDTHKEDDVSAKVSNTVLGRATMSNFFGDTTKGINVMENRFSKPTINISNNPRDVEDRIQNMVVMNRIRIGEFFKDYDKLRKGKVTANQFTTVLCMCNFNLTEEEFDFLTEKYKTEDNMVKYIDFVEHIDSAFTFKGIDKNPSVRVPTIEKGSILLKSKKLLEFDEQEKETMLQIMEAYRNVVRTRRLNLKPMFQDFDRTNSGHISKNQFVRVLNQLSIDISPDILSMVLKKYMDKGNVDEVNYFEFITDVDRPEDMFGAGRDFNHSYDYFSVTDPRKVGLQIVGLQPEDLDDVLSRIRKECSQKRIRLQEFFRDFDRLRSGNITQPQFRIGMSMAKIDLSTAEFEILINSYASELQNMFRWKEFCDAIDVAFQIKNLEKDVTVDFVQPNLDTKYNTIKPSKDDTSLAQRVVRKFKEKIRRERLDAKSFFQSWDKHNRFKVSPKQFRQVLATFGFEMTDAEDQAL